MKILRFKLRWLVSSRIVALVFLVLTHFSFVNFHAAWGEENHTTKPLNIAAIFSLTGKGANSNRSSVLGTRLAVDEINSSGGVLGKPLNLILLDNMSTPIGSSLAATQAINSGAIGIIGAQFSSHSLAVAKVAQKNHVPMISNFSTHPQLTAIGQYIFRVCFTDNFQGKVMAEFARRDLKASSAIIFVDLTSDYSLELSEIFRNHFNSLGGTVVGEIEYKAKKIDLNRLVAQAKSYNSDVIFLSGHEESGGIALKLQNSGITAVLLGGDGWTDKAFFMDGGNKLNHGYFCTHWSEFSERDQTVKFIKNYGSLDDFGTGAALAYDAVMVLAEAIKAARSTEGADIAKALSGMNTYEGVTGSIKFGPLGDPVKSAVIMEIINGQPRYLKTLTPN